MGADIKGNYVNGRTTGGGARPGHGAATHPKTANVLEHRSEGCDSSKHSTGRRGHVKVMGSQASLLVYRLKK